MSTQEMENLLSRYIDGDLSEDQRRRVAELLASDPQAAETLRHYERLDDALAALPLDLDAVDYEAFAHQVARRIQKVPAQRRARGLPWRLLAPFAAAAVFMVVALPRWLPQQGETSTLPILAVSQGVVVHAGMERPTSKGSVQVVRVRPQVARVNPVSRVSLISISSPEAGGEIPAIETYQGQSDLVICIADPYASAVAGGGEPVDNALLPLNQESLLWPDLGAAI